MKYYTQFLQRGLNGEITEACGSDGVYILDGRNSINTMIIDSHEKMRRLRNVRPGFIGFKIIKGTRFSNNNKVIREVFCSNQNNERIIERDL